MAQQSFKLEDIIDLAEEVRLAGFNVGTQQYVAAQDLLIVLAAHNRLPEDPRQWQTLLAPIFCSSPGEQEEFAKYFQAWLRRQPALIQQIAEARRDEAHKEKDEANAGASPRQWFKRPLVWALAAALFVMALGVAFLMAKTDRTLNGQVFSETEDQPLKGANVTFLGQPQATDEQGRFSFTYQIRNYDRLRSAKPESLSVEHIQHYPDTSTVALQSPVTPPIKLKKLAEVPNSNPTNPNPLTLPTPEPSTTPQPKPEPSRSRQWSVLIAALPLLLFGLWMLWRWYRRRMLLQKLAASGTPRLRQLKVNREDVPLFASTPFRRVIQELRRHRQTAVSDLDIAATVSATIRRGGLFNPAYGSRRALPEYLLLIDRAGPHDEQARVGEELAERLKAGDNYVDCYYFQGDAGTCRRVELSSSARALPAYLSPALTLNELAALHPDHRLLIFGDGVGFFDPFTGEPARWLEQFAQWERRAVLTPEAPAEWGYREEVLAEQDFQLLPASAAGFDALTEWLNFSLAPELARANAAPPFPELAAERPKRWLERHAPQPHVIDQLHKQVRDYLGADGWDWLCACAVYPQVTWEITLYLGGRLFGKREEWAENVLKLVRLPWFRYGTMPDWWRERLIATFAPEREREVRAGIEDLLRSALTKPHEPLSLEVAQAETLRERWQRWRQRRALFRLLQAQPEESPLRDYVFLSFLAGQPRTRLTVKVPDLLRRLLFKEGLAALGWRPVTAGAAAVALAGILLLALWPKQPPRKPIDIAQTTPTPAVTPDVSPTPLTSPSTTPTPLTSPSTTPTAKPSPTTAASPSPGSTPDLPPVASDQPNVAQQTPYQGAQGVAPVFQVTQTASGFNVEMSKGVTLEMNVVRGGDFTMGSDKSSYDAEKPPHQVKLSPFWMGKFEVTQAQWNAVMDKNLSNFKGDDLPVDSISWNDAVEFCRRLSEKSGVKFQLPTEAQWEYAARAGSNTEYSFGDDEKLLDQYAWYSGNSGNKTHPVGKKLSNKFGLYDMHGNVYEWCQDWYDENYYAQLQKQGVAVNPQGPAKGQYRVLRGGSWGDFNLLRSAARNGDAPDHFNYTLGVRVVCVARTS